MGKNFDYRGYKIRLKDDYLNIYDSKGNYLKRVWGINHGSLTEAKMRIDKIIKK